MKHVICCITNRPISLFIHRHTHQWRLLKIIIWNFHFYLLKLLYKNRIAWNFMPFRHFGKGSTDLKNVIILLSWITFFFADIAIGWNFGFIFISGDMKIISQNIKCAWVCNFRGFIIQHIFYLWEEKCWHNLFYFMIFLWNRAEIFTFIVKGPFMAMNVPKGWISNARRQWRDSEFLTTSWNSILEKNSEEVKLQSINILEYWPYTSSKPPYKWRPKLWSQNG